MSSFGAALLLLSAGAAASPQTPVDPFLPDALREVVTSASKAELDKKRGPNNAVAALEAEKTKVAGKAQLEHALALRVAGTTLRKTFLEREEFPMPERYVQAMSTFARLDLHEPGLVEWLDQTVAQNPDAAKQLGKKPWKMRAAILTRTPSLDKNLVAKAFAAAFEKVGVKLEIVPAKDAPLVITVGAEDAPREGQGDSAVKVTLQMESIKDGKLAWKGSLFRVEAAKDPAVALGSSLGWLSRIAGRDLFFQWLSEHGLPGLADAGPKRGKPGHAGHDH